MSKICAPVSFTRVAPLALLRSAGLAALPFALTVAVFLPAPAQAQVTVTTTPFTGTLNESFESFPNFSQDPNTYRADPTSIFGGAASLSGSRNVIYEPSAGSNFDLGDNGTAQVADGTKALGVNGRPATINITFSSLITDFGGYFNAFRSNTAPDTVTFTFLDSGNVLVGTQTVDVNPSNTTTGALNFFGFTSTTPFQSVTITGNYVVLDALRANPVTTSATVPEPSQYAMGGMLGASLLLSMVKARRRTAKKVPATA